MPEIPAWRGVPADGLADAILPLGSKIGVFRALFPPRVVSVSVWLAGSRSLKPPKSSTYAPWFAVNRARRLSIEPRHDLPLGGPFGRLRASRTLAAKMSTMTSKKKIAADLQSALSGQSPLSIDLYVEVLADYEDELKASLDKDADDALLCMLADDGDVAMMVIDWDGSIYRNENALKKLQAMWRQSFDTNVQTLMPILSDHISQKNLGVAGIKWLPASSD